MKRALVFPGQGSQMPGMGQALAEAFPAARDVFDEVDDALSTHLSRLMFEGPESELMLTENAQPALLAASLAVIRVLESEAGFAVARETAYVAGHSLGEYSALAAAGALSVAEAARLVKRRGQAMQQAVPVGEGAMAALLGLDIAAARDIAEAAAQGQVCAVANDNCPGQIVVSGHKGAVERAVALAAEQGGRRSIMLPVSAPFHCALMGPAAEIMAEALAESALAARRRAARRQCDSRGDEPTPRKSRSCSSRRRPGWCAGARACCCLPPTGSRRWSKSAPGGCSPASSSASTATLSALSVGTPAEVEALIQRL